MNTETEKERLKRIERGVLEASRLHDDEVEDIVTAPHLFRSIKATVERQRSIGVQKSGLHISLWTWQLKLVTSAVVAIVMAVAIGISLTTRKQPVAREANVHDVPDVAIDLPKQFDASRAIALDESGRIDQPVMQRASLKTNELRTRSKQRREDVEEVSEFYPLTYTDGQDTSVDGSQLVRVELPRSSLMAMGVDPPAGNDAPKVKTDLLIGSDGVMKAVRFVK